MLSPGLLARLGDALLRRAVLWNRRRLHRRTRSRTPAYADWCARHDTLDVATLEALRRRLQALPASPVLGLWLAARGSAAAHAALWADLQAQLYPMWTLHVDVMPDDDADTVAAWRERAAASHQVRLHPGSIPVPGDAPWWALLRAGQHWRPHALLLLVEAAVHHHRSELVYGDEDQLDPKGRRCHPHFKPDWNPELRLCSDALGQAVLWRRERLVAALRGDETAQPAARWALAVRGGAGLTDAMAVHVPHILLHDGAPQAFVPEATAQAVRQALHELGEPAQVTPVEGQAVLRVKFALPVPPPSVTIVIPMRNRLQLSRCCVESICQRSSSSRWDIVIVDNGSDDPACLRWLRDVQQDPRIRVWRDEGPFNYAALNNAAVNGACGEFVVLLNNDIEVISAGWLDEMVSLAARPGIGAVGTRLWYSDGSLQHGGVVLGIRRSAGHAYRRWQRGEAGMGGRAQALQGYSAVTAACLAVRRQTYLDVGGLDEDAFAIALNDVDFCLKLRSAGWRNLWTPHAELFHHESVSRGSDKNLARRAGMERELATLQQRWPAWLAWDPAYNPNLSLDDENFALAEPPRVSLRQPWFDQSPWSAAGAARRLPADC